MERAMNDKVTNNDQKNPIQDHIRDIPFNEKEVSIIASCSLWMRFIGYFSNISAIFTALIGLILIGSNLFPKTNIKNIYIGLLFIVIAILPFFMGKWILRSSRAFTDVINTAIDDQGFLIEGFGFLQKFFLSIGIIFIVFIVIALLGILYFSVNSVPVNEIIK
jgi:hypothetical protein